MSEEKNYNDALKLAQKIEANSLLKTSVTENYMFFDPEVADQMTEPKLKNQLDKHLKGYEGKVIVVGHGDDNHAMLEAIKRVGEGANIHLVTMGDPGFGHVYMVPPNEPFVDGDARKHIQANLTKKIDDGIIDIMGINEKHSNTDVENTIEDQEWEEPKKHHKRKMGLAGTIGLIHAMGMMDMGLTPFVSKGRGTMRNQYLDMNDIPEQLDSDTPIYDEPRSLIPRRKKKYDANLANQHIIDESLKSYHIIASKQPDGTKQFDYPDGFKCFARDQKNADRKHNNYLKENTNK